MRVHSRDEKGDPKVWTATVYIEDEEFAQKMKDLKETEGLTDTEAYKHALREKYQLDQ